ncbi:MAG: type II secretion system protein GspG [Sedimentisphaerales bacterium]|nr:type II secretion system protein GspG [Sedimentisphaerales bacterium]
MKNTIKAAISLGIIVFFFAAGEGCIRRDNSEQRRSIAKAKMSVIEVAIENYRLDCDRYPNSLDELLQASAELEGKWDGPYLKSSQLLDPWGNKYIFVPEGQMNPGSYDLISYGADGKPGGEGQNEDIYND